MAKNYSDNTTDFSSKQLPRIIVIQRIIAFSKSHNAQQQESDFFKIIKN